MKRATYRILRHFVRGFRSLPLAQQSLHYPSIASSPLISHEMKLDNLVLSKPRGCQSNRAIAREESRPQVGIFTTASSVTGIAIHYRAFPAADEPVYLPASAPSAYPTQREHAQSTEISNIQTITYSYREPAPNHRLVRF